MTPSNDSRTEWRRYGLLPIAAALGYATSVLHVYSMGAFIEPIQQDFAWSRAQTSSGLSIAAFLSAIFCIPIGVFIDRIGPRRVGLVGVVLMTGSVGLIGTATGGKTNWILLWTVVALGNLGVQATVWASAVNSRFEASRGLALAVTLSGASVAATILPVLATWLIGEYGWRSAYMAMSGIWITLVFPVLFVCFRSAKDEGAEQAATQTSTPEVALSGLTLKEGVRSPAFYKLLMASGMFAFTAVAVVVHFVPILTDSGAEPLAAAGIASLVGIFSVIGRLGTGALLDRFPGHRVGGLAFLIPLVGCSLLLVGDGNRASQSVAAAVFGLTLGSEVDVIAYLAARYFGMKNFGALYGALVMALALGTAFGPLAAGAVFDHYTSYDPFLVLTMALMGSSAVTLFTMAWDQTVDEGSGEPGRVRSEGT